MATDPEIENALAGLDVQQVPFEGKWHTAPYPEREVAGRTCAILVDDPGIQQLVVRRDNGEVLFAAPDNDATELVNRSLAQFATCAQIYLDARQQAESIGDNDKALRKNGKRAFTAIRKADRDAVRDENQFWLVATEELGYGI